MRLPITGMLMPAERALSFGYQRTKTHKHQGIDIFAPEGTPVVACGPAQVILLQRKPSPMPTKPGVVAGGYGAQVVLKYADGSYTRASHLREGSIPEGLQVGGVVKEGAVIGEVGRTSWAWVWVKAAKKYRFRDLFAVSNAHCHFECLVKWPTPRERNRIDPRTYFRMRGVSYVIGRRRNGSHVVPVRAQPEPEEG